MSANNLDFKQTVSEPIEKFLDWKALTWWENIFNWTNQKLLFYEIYEAEVCNIFLSWHALKALTETQYLNTSKPKECNP